MGYNTRKACFRYIQESQDQDRDWLNRYILIADALSGFCIDAEVAQATAPSTGSLTDGDIGRVYVQHDGGTPSTAEFFHIWGGSYLGLISIPAYPAMYYSKTANNYKLIQDDLEITAWNP